MPGPPIPSAPPLGAQLPRPSEVKPGVLPPPQYAKLPESTYPTTKPPLKLVETAPPAGVTDLPPILPPKDVKPLLTSNPKPVELPAPSLPVKPPLIEAPRSKVGEDGFGPGPRLPAAATEPVVVVPPTQAANVDPALPLKSGEKFGHSPDYRWIAGVVDRHLKGGYFTIRYADIGTDDLWGGKVRLLDDDRLRDLRNGDLVYVEGEVMAPQVRPRVRPTRHTESQTSASLRSIDRRASRREPHDHVIIVRLTPRRSPNSALHELHRPIVVPGSDRLAVRGERGAVRR